MKKAVATKVHFDIEQSYYGKFLQNEEKIRNLATVDPNSYAAVVVKSMDHLITASALMKEHLSKPTEGYCIERILGEYSGSLRASELFVVWSQQLLRNIKTMADETIESHGCESSDADRDARVCLVVMTNQISAEDSLDFVRVCRKKYPNEVFFQRIFSDLFTYTEDWDSGLKASEELSKLFPNDAEVLNSRAGMLRLTTDKNNIDYKNWNRLKKQIEVVKEAYKTYLKIAPKDHRHFAENNYVMAYLSLKYSTPSTQMSQSDLQEINLYFQMGLDAEKDVLPCFLPFHSGHKDIVAKYVNIEPTTFIDMTSSGLASTSHTGPVPTENIEYIDLRKPTKRRIDVCVSHRQRLKMMLSDPATKILAELNAQNTDSILPANIDLDDFDEIVLYQMTYAKVSEIFTLKVIELTVVEDSMYDSGFFETVVADKTRDVIRLRLDLGAARPDSHAEMVLMKKFRFGTVWKLRNPDFHMENGDESTMYIR